MLAELNVLKAKALYFKNKNEEAKSTLLESIIQVQAEGIMQIFINEGTEIENILKEIKKEKATKNTKLLNSVSSDYLKKILDTF